MISENLLNIYKEIEFQIKQRLSDFKNIQAHQYFYEFCFCLLTPQSKAEYALVVQSELEAKDFLNFEFNPVSLLNNPKNYIRFHNQKANRLLWLRNNFHLIENLLNNDITTDEKRNWLAENINGIGMKEAGHFLRNIGYNNLAILDRHILRMLVQCEVFEEIPDISSKKKYIEVEVKFRNFAEKEGISVDEFDLLFFYHQTGKILK